MALTLYLTIYSFLLTISIYFFLKNIKQISFIKTIFIFPFVCAISTALFLLDYYNRWLLIISRYEFPIIQCIMAGLLIISICYLVHQGFKYLKIKNIIIKSIFLFILAGFLCFYFTLSIVIWGPYDEEKTRHLIVKTEEIIFHLHNDTNAQNIYNQQISLNEKIYEYFNNSGNIDKVKHYAEFKDYDLNKKNEICDIYGNNLIILDSDDEAVFYNFNGEKFTVRLNGLKKQKSFAIWSIGPNGINEYGQGDDINITIKKQDKYRFYNIKGVLKNQSIEWEQNDEK